MEQETMNSAEAVGTSAEGPATLFVLGAEHELFALALYGDRGNEEAMRKRVAAAIESLRQDAYADGRRDAQEELASVLPGVTYMDPPDGGAPTILEQLQRQAKDAKRYLWLQQRFIAADFDWNESGTQALIFEHPGSSVSADCDATIDRAMKATGDSQ